MVLHQWACVVEVFGSFWRRHTELCTVPRKPRRKLKVPKPVVFKSNHVLHSPEELLKMFPGPDLRPAESKERSPGVRICNKLSRILMPQVSRGHLENSSPPNFPLPQPLH